jgi:aldehyde:ferredoxin oxidoreductase
MTVDVTEREAHESDIDDVLERYLGGRGVATKVAHDRIPVDADPFGPENRVYFSTGPLQLSRMSCTGRMNTTGLSPLTNGIVSANAGGYLSRNFADAGYSTVEIAGASDELLVIHVTDEGIEFEEVPELEGATVPEVTDYVDRERGLGAENVLCIGPAGENLVRYA